MSDILEELETFMPRDNPRKWAKLLSTVQYRRLELSLLREILLELREIRELLEELRRELSPKG